MHRNMALVEMRQLRRARGDHRPLRYKDGDGGALRLVVLFGDIEHLRPDHVRQRRKDLGQAFAVVLPVDIGDIVALFARAAGVADVIDIEAQRLRKIVEPVQIELFSHCKTLRHKQKKRYALAHRFGTIAETPPDAHRMSFETRVYIANTLLLLLLLIVLQACRKALRLSSNQLISSGFCARSQ